MTSIHASQRNIRETDELLKDIAVRFGVQFLQPLSIFCKQDKCTVTLQINDITVPVAWDDSHLTLEGAMYLSAELNKLIKIY